MTVQIVYLVCAVLFILAIHRLSAPQTAVRGNYLAAAGMLAALAVSLYADVKENSILIYTALAAGILSGSAAGLKVKMTALPQMVSLLNGAGGLASALIVSGELSLAHPEAPVLSAVCLVAGCVTFSGSLLAFAKLQGIIKRNFNLLKWTSLPVAAALVFFECLYVQNGTFLSAVTASAFVLGITVTLPVGGADMPVIISLLNALSGWTVVLVGVSLNDLLLIISGTLIGSGGSILAYVMSRAMNRSLLKILWPDKKFGTAAEEESAKSVKTGTPEEAAFFLSNSRKVIIVPGFGMAAAQAQNALKSLFEVLTVKYGAEVMFAVHPVAGRMPGHMNVLLAEAKIPYENVFELTDINQEFSQADAAYVIGANDVTNPAAKNDTTSPLYGMPVLEVEKAKTVFFVKRSMAAGYSGADNPLFYAPNTIMLFGDAKKVTEKIVKDMQTENL